MDLENIYRWILAFSSFYGYETTVYIRGIIDSTITLNCSLRGLSTEHSIIWKGPPNETNYCIQNHLYLNNIPKYLKPRLKIVGNFNKGFYNLQIKDLHLSDEGFYMCHQFRSKHNEYFYLDVIGLNVTVSKPSYVGEIGSSITLGCSITSKSNDISEVRWYFYSSGKYHLLEPSSNTGKYSKPTPENPSLTIEKLDLNDVGPYICSATNGDGLNVNSTATHLSLLDSKENRKVVFILGLICCLLVLLVVTGLVLRKNKPMLFLQIAYTFQKAEDDDSKLWDAFISFKSQDVDHQFVSSKLYMKLETQLGYKLCIHHKDFLPGKAIANNIVDSIANSRRTILIISREYLQGGYTTFELEMAHAEMIATKSKHKIIPILLDKYDNLQGSMDDTLKHIIQSVTYITWPGETSQRDVKSFWKRLELSMPKRSRKLRITSDETTPLLKSNLLESSA
ncbi:interleukin-18 receptor 1-like [Mytilus californianus]|uniref:interleukin-18 receptor 1-like n=1 Tax=Mytilus californianus TaxID=6549 RepID=UPI002245150D|nr:interleukin-18 receptor 1-like [Mytilus californianus]